MRELQQWGSKRAGDTRLQAATAKQDPGATECWARCAGCAEAARQHPFEDGAVNIHLPCLDNPPQAWHLALIQSVAAMFVTTPHMRTTQTSAAA